ncbi:MAG: PAS domain-containing protein [Pseudomonadota bacterium]
MSSKKTSPDTEAKTAPAEAEILREIADSSPALLFQLRKTAQGELGVTFVSHAVESFFGVDSTTPEANYKLFMSLLYSGDGDRIAKGLENSAKDMQPRDMEFRVHRMKDDTSKWVKAVVMPRRTDDGGLIWNGVMVDIEAQKAAEARIEATEKQLRDVTDNIAGVVFQRRQAPDGSISFPFLSKGFYRMNAKLNWGNYASMRETLQAIHPDDREKAEQVVKQSAETLEPYAIDYRLAIADGSYRWMRGSGVPRREDDGSIVWNGYTMDIHERMEADAEIAAAEHMLRELTSRLPGVVFQQRLEADGRLSYPFVSGKMATLPDELSSVREDARGLIEHIHEDDRAQVLSTVDESARTLEPYRIEYRLRTKSGAIHWLRTEAQPHRTEDGAVVWNGFSANITREKNAESRIREITAALTGTVYQLVATKQSGMRYTYVSGSAEAVWGLKRETIIAAAQSINDRIQIGDFLAMNKRFTEALRSGIPVQHDYRYHHPNGQVRWLRTTATARKPEPGVAVWNGYTTDVTAEREAQQRLTEVTETMPGAVFQLVPNGDNRLEVSFVSDGIERLIGMSKAEVEKNIAPLNDVIIEEDRAIMTATLRDSLRAKTAGVCDVRVRHHKTGKLMWIRAAASPNLTNPQRITWSGFWWDITDIKQLQDDLSRARDNAETLHDKLLGITNDMPGALFEFRMSKDREVEIPYVSGSIHALLGVTKEEIEKDRMALLELIPADAQLAINTMIRESLKTMQPRNADFQLRHKTTGLLRWIRAAAIPTGIPAAQNVVWRSFWQDITDIKELQQALVGAKETAESANRSKSEFLANMSHEIRTPMNAILGLSHLALRADPPPRLKSHLQKIDRASRSLLGVINDILDFSRIEAGKLGLEETPFSLDAVLEDLANLTGPSAQEKGLEFSCRAEAEVPRELVGDPLRLGQVLLNLVSNAVKFTERGHVRVNTERVREEKGRVVLLFTVEDSGIGLSHEQRSRLFRAFSQADTSTTRKYGGSGLGLSISKNLIEMMKGSIDVESEPGRGSRFFFTADLGLAEAGVLEKRGGPIAGKPLEGLRILVAEDNDINLEIAREVLEAAGAKVASASNGREAINALKESSYDAVVMDVNMPVLSGLEATREIRSLPRFAKLPVVAMTASAMADDRARCLEAGMNAHISKPIDVDEMIETLAKLTRGQAVVPRKTSAAAQLPDDLQALAAQLDLVAAVRRVNHNAVLYRRLLRTFAGSNRSWMADAQAALKEKNAKALEKMAHTLKGAAANLGAMRLAAAALELENAAHKGWTGLSSYVKAVDKPLKDLLTALIPLEPSQAAAALDGTLKSVDPARLRQLNRLLAHDDAKATDLAQALAQDFPHEPGFGQVLKQTAAYEFEAARVTLLKLSARLKIPV